MITSNEEEDFGPLIGKVKRCKESLFTCMATRAAHLELSKDLPTSAFINVMRRFIARREPSKCIHFDNRSNFVGTERIFKGT